ncbi:NAD(P)/FAD-dependent oxidoreductase [Pollutimonas sp. H1-120]|uniref:FAD-dependent oxidoreductase n=1 Tax=Pollutimonas sp. H1-120 TaxID=3148824 RepID=UPI003B52C7E4
MTERYDLIIVGAGPAGMHAAIEARRQNLSVLVADDQPTPGGQIWRAVERTAASATGDILGEDYQAGAAVVRAFRACGADYRPSTQVWQIESGWHVYMTHGQQATVVQADNILLATGAQERPAPFSGWTLPGVMTVGAAQILLKTSKQVPEQPVWIAGSGPLVLVYIKQLLQAGGRVAGWLDTAPPRNWRRGLPHFLGALGNWRELRKGYRWMQALRRAGVPIHRGVTDIRAEGEGRLSQLAFKTEGGAEQRVPAALLLVHEGIVPSIHMTRALECKLAWLPAQRCFSPETDEWGQSSQPGVFIAGDGAGIAGARAACLRGQLAGLGVARHMGKMDDAQASKLASPIRDQLARELALRPLLDAMYPPRANTASPSDDTIVCRCEELTAGDIRACAKLGQPGPNQIKSFTRAGMGPCQGRQCGYTIANILSEAQQRPVSDVGFYRIRPPLKPLTLGELASLDDKAPQA